VAEGRCVLMTRATITRLSGMHTTYRRRIVAAPGVDKQPIRKSDELWQSAIDFVTLESAAGQAVHRWLMRVIEFGLGHVVGNVIGAYRRGLF